MAYWFPLRVSWYIHDVRHYGRDNTVDERLTDPKIKLPRDKPPCRSYYMSPLQDFRMKTFLAQTLDQWRTWLAEHHDSESEVWLIFHKLHTGVASINYKDALDEA